MQREWQLVLPPRPPSPTRKIAPPGTAEAIKKLMEENPVVIVGRRGCFMIHVIKHLLTVQGVDPVVSEIGPDHDVTTDDRALVEELGGEVGTAEQVLPVLVVGGQVVGGVDKVIAIHLSGLLALKLKEASAYLSLNLF